MNSTKLVRTTISCFDDFERSQSPVTLRALVECGIYWSCDSAINKATVPILERIHLKDGMSEQEIIVGYEGVPSDVYPAILESMRSEIDHLRSAILAKDTRR